MEAQEKDTTMLSEISNQLFYWYTLLKTSLCCLPREGITMQACGK